MTTGIEIDSGRCLEAFSRDSDLSVRTTLPEVEGLREGVLTCGTCYSFRACSSNNPNKRADDCYVSKEEIEPTHLVD